MQIEGLKMPLSRWLAVPWAMVLDWRVIRVESIVLRINNFIFLQFAPRDAILAAQFLLSHSILTPMIYITQFIFIHPGKEKQFLEFESVAIPMMEEYKGKILYRIRPDPEQFVDHTGEVPYEIHFIQFNSKQDLELFMKDKRRVDLVPLKEESVREVFLVQGARIG